MSHRKQEGLAMSEEKTQPEGELADIVSRVVREGDNERISSFCSLLNTFNYSVQVQSDRIQWEPSDFKAFAIALCAMDQIGLSDRDAAMQNNITAMRK